MVLALALALALVRSVLILEPFDNLPFLLSGSDSFSGRDSACFFLRLACGCDSSASLFCLLLGCSSSSWDASLSLDALEARPRFLSGLVTSLA